MAINTNQRNDYVGNGATATFPYTFKIFAETDLQVTRRDTNGGETTLSWPTDFSVSGVGHSAGGAIVLAAGNLASDWGITIKRVRPLSQGTTLSNQSAYQADAHENTFDNLTMLVQQLNDAINRAVRVQESLSLSGLSLVLPPPVALQTLGWDATGKILTNIPVGNNVPSSMDAPNVTYLQAGSGAVSRSVRDRLREVVSVKDFGAVGDGIVDDTTAIQNALTFAASIGASVFVPQGTYLVSNYLTVSTGVTVFGAGWKSIIYAATDLPFPPDWGGSASSVLFVAVGATDVTIRDLYVKGPYSGSGDGSTTFGIGVGRTATDVQVLNCKVTHASWSGIFNATETSRILIQGNRTETNAIDGIESWATSTQIINNHSYNDGAALNPAGGGGIEILPGSTHVLVKGNIIEVSNLVGIVVSGGGTAQSMIVIDSNIVISPGTRGIVDNAGTTDLTIHNNLVDSPRGSGALGYAIYLANTTRFKVSHNTVTNANVGSGPSGIQVEGTANHGSISHNMAHNNWVGVGIAVGTGASGSIEVSHNHAYGSGSGVDFSNGSAGFIFENLNSWGATAAPSKLSATQTNDNAAAGYVGEYIESQVAVGSAVALTTDTTANVTSISLGPGDWDISVSANFKFAPTTSYTILQYGISTTSVTLPNRDALGIQEVPASVPSGNTDPAFATPVVRLSLAATTTVYFVVRASFTVDTLSAYGKIRARRMR